MPPSHKLNASDVRECAHSISGCREVATFGDGVVSFLTGLDTRQESKLARINVYLETGTVGINRCMGDQVREIFRRNVYSVSALERIMLDPPQLTEINKNRVSGEDLVSQMELAELGVCILMGERENLQNHLKQLESKSQVAAEESEDESLEGMEFEFCLPEDVMPQAEQCLEDIAKLNKHVTCVSTNGKGVVFLYGNGGVAYTSNCPRPLYSKLKALRSNPRASRPSYVSLGSRERYFVNFFDGTKDWKGPKSLDKVLSGPKHAKKSKHFTSPPPRSVAFGSTYDTFVIVFDDGSYEYQGKAVPKELVEKLRTRSDKPDLVCVTLGPKGEWFLRAGNGRMWWGGISAELDELIQGLLAEDRYLNFLDFGEDGAFFLTYD